LQETVEREAGKRSDGRIRRYCVGCYAALSAAVGRARAKIIEGITCGHRMSCMQWASTVLFWLFCEISHVTA